MGYWCEFAPAYGFHQGFVHPIRGRTVAFGCMVKRRRNFMPWFEWARRSISPRRKRKTRRLVQRCSGWMIRAHRTRIRILWLAQQRFKNRAAASRRVARPRGQRRRTDFVSTNLISSGTTAREKVNLRTPDVMAAVQEQVESHYRSDIVERFGATAGLSRSAT